MRQVRMGVQSGVVRKMDFCRGKVLSKGGVAAMHGSFRAQGELHRRVQPVFAAQGKQGETNASSEKQTQDQEDELAELRKDIPSLQEQRRPRRQADSSDWISSQLTRRFGIAGGLVWLGILLFGVISEQVKTRLENAAEEQGTKDVANAVQQDLGGGLSFTDTRKGGGAAVQQGYLTVLHYKGYANGQLFEDTKERGKPLVYLFGGRPFTAGLCLGVEKGMQGMKAGGIRSIDVPSNLGFGDQGINLRGTTHVPDKAAQGEVPANADLRYVIELIRVSIPPS